MRAIDLRPETAEDEPFLRRLFVSTRVDEFAAAGLPPQAIDLLLAQQYDLQRRHYRAAFLDADWSIVERRGIPVGRLYVAREMAGRRIVDIAILPEAKGQGIGGILIDRVLAEARRADRPVHLHVRPENRARRLYLRKGFVETGVEGGDIMMTWRP